MLTVENLSKAYVAGRSTVQAVDAVDLRVETGKLLTLLGPSGCGKTTTLRCIAGLERPDGGRIVIGDTAMFDSACDVNVPPSDRGIGMVFQSYAIWPHMTVFENVAFPLQVARERTYAAAEIKERVLRTLDMVRLNGFEDRSATQLSGGQQQRLAFARGLVREPKILLLDEPLSNLDAKLREQMRFELKRLQRRLGITTVYVTHDQSEALALSDEIAVFNGGRIVQRGSPQNIYRNPQSQFVADFIGSANFITGRLLSDAREGGMVGVTTRHGIIRCSYDRDVTAGQPILVAARPEDLTLYQNHPGAGLNVFTGKVANRVFLGDVVDYVIDFGGQEVRVRARPEFDFHIGEAVHVGIPPHKCVGLPF